MERLVNSIDKGIVIDHITPGLGIKLYRYLGLDEAQLTVVVITNAESRRMGRKDIIKIRNIIDLDYTVIGLIDDKATINVIEDGKISEKKKLELPERVIDVIRCKNPRCITSGERDIRHEYVLQNRTTGTYRCLYCEEQARGIEL